MKVIDRFKMLTRGAGGGVGRMDDICFQSRTQGRIQGKWTLKMVLKK